MYTAIFKVDSQQELTVQHRELCSVLSGSLDDRGVWERRETYICKIEYVCICVYIFVVHLKQKMLYSLEGKL